MPKLPSIFSLSLVALVGASLSGCKEEPPAPQPEPAASASAASISPKSRIPVRTPTSPVPKVDPLTMKQYRVELCSVGVLTLRQARDAYFASLGGGEPSDKKIPSFGQAGTSPSSRTPLLKTDLTNPTARTAPGGAASAAKGAPATATSGAKTAPAVGSGTPRAPFEMALRAPHERNARACTAAAAMKEPAMDGVDAAVAEMGPFAVDLAKAIVTANSYYQKEEYKADKFAKGKEMHKKLVEDFKKFDELYAKLADSVDAYKKAHPMTTTDEGEKLTQAALDDARSVLFGLLPAKVDVEAFKAATAKLEADVEALKTFGKGQPTDPWSKIMAPALDAYARAAKGASEKLTAKGVDNEQFLTLVTGMTSLIESRHRAFTRALVARERKEAAVAPSAAAPQENAPSNDEHQE